MTWKPRRSARNGRAADLGDDPLRGGQAVFVQCRRVIQRRDLVGGEGLGNPLRLHVRVDHANVHRHAVVTGHLIKDLKGPVHVRLCPRAASRTDDQRYVALPGRRQKQREIPQCRAATDKGFAGAEVERAGVDTAGIHGDRVALSAKAAPQRLYRKAVPQNGRG